MPKYKQLNTLKAKRALPEFYWTAKTDMNCMKQVIEQTKATSQSHHIQRLMVTGNFALLAGLDPEQVCEWYLAVYLDAYEWVELPNTLGMALHGDGGIVGSKPYAASGNYIDKMSNFCKNCRYNVKEKTGDNACPFNYLYWNFFLTHEDTFKKNPRLKFVYNTLSKKSSEEKNEIKNSAKRFLSSL